MRRRAEVGSLCLVLLVGVPGPAGAQTKDVALPSEIEQLIDLTGAAALGAQASTFAFEQMLRDLTRSQPNIPDRAISVVKAVLSDELSKAFAAPDMRARQAAIYTEHFTPDEVRQMLAFYSTPAGRKASTVLPLLLQEGMAAGQEWTAANVERIGALIEARFKAEEIFR